MTTNKRIHDQLVRVLRRYLVTDNNHGPSPILHILTASNGKFSSSLISTSTSMFEGEEDPRSVLDSFTTMMGTDRGQVLATTLLGEDLVGLMFTCTAVHTSPGSLNIAPIHGVERYGFACALIDDEEAYVVQDVTAGVTEERDVPPDSFHSSLMDSLVSLLLAMDDARNAPASPDLIQVAHGMLSSNDPIITAGTGSFIRSMRNGRGLHPRDLGRGVGSDNGVFMLQEAMRHAD